MPFGKAGSGNRGEVGVYKRRRRRKRVGGGASDGVAARFRFGVGGHRHPRGPARHGNMCVTRPRAPSNPARRNGADSSRSARRDGGTHVPRGNHRQTRARMRSNSGGRALRTRALLISSREPHCALSSDRRKFARLFSMVFRPLVPPPLVCCLVVDMLPAISTAKNRLYQIVADILSSLI